MGSPLPTDAFGMVELCMDAGLAFERRCQADRGFAALVAEARVMRAYHPVELRRRAREASNG